MMMLAMNLGTLLRTVHCKGLMANLGRACRSQAVLMSLLHHKHTLGKKQLQMRLTNVTSVALTTNIWTSKATEANQQLRNCVCALYLSFLGVLLMCLETKPFLGCHIGVIIIIWCYNRLGNRRQLNSWRS